MKMSSRLVETMMINVEDFADSFLTCGTCLSGYDSACHSAKLLPCSHTVCRTCLERILETQKSMAECEAEEDTMRCPICRETIIVPRGGGGAASFPPAFIVNQLLDLMASQRRDRVPKCRRHPGQELLFCETCDIIFCPDCRGGNTRGHATEACGGTDPSEASIGSSGAALSHNVISFSVAIKRCSEILLYKASLCAQELNSAQEAVMTELQRLSESSEACIAAAESSFAEIRALVERRQAEVIQNIQRKSEEKRSALKDQLALIESERSLVREQCDQLNTLIDVRSISKGISYLNDKLDTIASLTEPRENAFLRYEDDPHVASEAAAGSDLPTTTNSPQPGSTGFVDIARCLAAFGRITVSTTYPPLCTANLPEEMHAHLPAKVKVQAYDYHGEPQTTGKDPISVHFKDPNGREAPSVLIDNCDGSYEITLCPVSAGPHTLAINILSRPIRSSPYAINVCGRQKPQWSIADGPDSRSLVQPFAVAVLQSESTDDTDDSTTYGIRVLLLDTGNSRLLVADAETGEIQSVLTGNDALKGQAATGMALSPQGLWIVNWRANELMLLNIDTNEIIDRIKSPQFMEPTSVSYCPQTDRVLVADNGAGCVFACQNGEVHPIIGSGGGSSAQATANLSGSMRGSRKFERYANDALRRITGICVMSSGEIVLAAGSELRIYSPKGIFLGTLYAPMSSGYLCLQPQPSPQRLTPIDSEIDAEGTCLPSALTQKSSPLRTVSCLAGGSSGAGGLSSAPGSTLTLGSLRHSVGGPLVRPASTIGGANTSTSSALRGLFGGVSATKTSTDLGECLLASHTDRSRSAVVVFPEYAWRGAITEQMENDDDGGDNGDGGGSSGGEELGSSLMRYTRRQAYALEVEPGLRRLAGLAALPQDTPSSSSSHPCLVAVDLGGQSAYCLRFV